MGVDLPDKGQFLTINTLNSGDKILDAIYFIQFTFKQFQLTEDDKIKVLEFLNPIKK